MQIAKYRKSLLALVVSLASVLSATSAKAIELTSQSGVTTSASSCYGGCGGPYYDHSNIIDKDFGGSGNSGLNSWNAGYAGGSVQINFGTAYILDRIELYGGNNAINSYSLSVSLDGLTWQQIATGAYHLESNLSNTAVYNGVKFGAVHDVSASNINAQYLRYTRTTGDATWGYLYEMSVQGHVAAVPEPETYAMMLAGLGLIGGVARRKKQQQASA